MNIMKECEYFDLQLYASAKWPFEQSINYKGDNLGI